ncbi:hypothetical protein O6H91_14G055300 [Diphasiastrum complanatum]|uniref:Uncharacterized protein n=1 Tax=Diphasiastrum complanatum TaxID=34168 RepID=A0ACC2BPN7_DIPCM|nr:hypothetical protein O6H91_14G055300 [Diphasiastrum complanatum]
MALCVPKTPCRTLRSCLALIKVLSFKFRPVIRGFPAAVINFLMKRGSKIQIPALILRKRNSNEVLGLYHSMDLITIAMFLFTTTQMAYANSKLSESYELVLQKRACSFSKLEFDHFSSFAYSRGISKVFTAFSFSFV